MQLLPLLLWKKQKKEKSKALKSSSKKLDEAAAKIHKLQATVSEMEKKMDAKAATTEKAIQKANEKTHLAFKEMASMKKNE